MSLSNINRGNILGYARRHRGAIQAAVYAGQAARTIYDLAVSHTGQIQIAAPEGRRYQPEERKNKKRKRDKDPPQEQAAMSSSSNNGDEVQVVPIPRRISKIVPDYFTIRLPYADHFNVSMASGAKAITTRPQIRLNSIFDPRIDAILGDHQPMGRDTWASIFKYYRVIITDVKITTFNENNDSFILGYSLTDDVTDIPTDVISFVESKNSVHQLLPGVATNATCINELNYTYKPETWDHHVREVGTEERWTAIGSNPTINHFMVMHGYQWNGVNISGNADIRVLLHINFVVQFREAIDTIFNTVDGTGT